MLKTLHDPKPIGYIEDTIADDHYITGTLSAQQTYPDRNWLTFLPSEEKQKLMRVETSNCTAFGTMNVVEGFMKRVYGLDVNFSDRYLGSRAGTTARGNSPHKVAETLRNFAGAVPEKDLPFTDVQDIDEYYNAVNFSHKLSGAVWLREWEVRHEWALNGTETNWQDQLYDALQFSPIGIAVQAWSREGERYVRTGKDTHWASLVYAVKGHYWVVFDSYAPHIKKLSWDYGFTRAKRYDIFPREDFSLQFYARLGAGFFK